MINFTELKPDYEGLIGECKWSFKLFIFSNEFQKKGYFRGLIIHQGEDGGMEPITGILSEDSLEFNEEETFGNGQNSMRYEFSFKTGNLISGFKVKGKQIRLAKMIQGVFRDNHIRKATIWKC